MIIGLCQSCQHAVVIANDRGSVFYLCERSKTDPRFPRYPPLPVLECLGYDKSDDRVDGKKRPDARD
jgi:hypothetical protein